MSFKVLADEPLSEIVVTAELLETNALRLPNSVTVIESDAIHQRNAQHLEDLLNLSPNLNFSTGASRGRFIQVRGIGERSEFQEPIINSVGVLMDGIDLTGIASAATTLDIKQAEVLRGPQGTLFGANALAGLVNLVSNTPSEDHYVKLSGLVEQFGGLGLEGVLSGPTSKHSGYRLAVKHYQNEGYIDNVFLARDDTNHIDETAARLRYVSQVNNALKVDASIFVADINNGYDAFSLDNTRQTYSDQPGVDRQETLAAAVKLNYAINSDLTLESLLSVANSTLEYSYDEDWSHTGICNDTACDSTHFGFDWFYSSFDQYQRENDNTSLDFRLMSNGKQANSWVAGLYHRDQNIHLDRVYTFADFDFSSDLQTSNTALYGQYNLSLNSNWSVSAGARLEKRELDYSDNSGATASPDGTFFGGRIAIEYLADSGAFYYALISRGYKPGGFNLGGVVPTSLREFDEETMTNYEFGIKNSILDGALNYQLSLFYQDRGNIQTKQSIVSSIATGQPGGLCPCSFTDFTDNATTGSNRGLELELNWVASERIRMFATLGLLDTDFDDFLTFEHINADRENGVAFNLNGREQAHAPNYQWLIGGEFSVTPHWRINASIEAKDDFFFSDRHSEKSDAYELLNLEITYQTDRWQMALYGKNLTDELVKTRGFGSFGNDPRKFYETEAYNQFAAPRVVGVKATLEF